MHTDQELYDELSFYTLGLGAKLSTPRFSYRLLSGRHHSCPAAPNMGECFTSIT